MNKEQEELARKVAKRVRRNLHKKYRVVPDGMELSIETVLLNELEKGNWMKYDSSWRDSIPKKRFRLVTGPREVVFKYPVFTSVEEGFAYIEKVLDPYLTGQYGIVDDAQTELTNPQNPV